MRGLIALLCGVWIVVAGCGHSTPEAEKREAVSDQVRVYFIRPKMRYSGATDRAAKISIDGIPMLSLDKGYYSLVELPAGSRNITVASYTQYGDENRVIEVKEDQLFHFIKGQDYFIKLEPYQRGYRWGTSFKPVSIDHAVALKDVSILRAYGKAKADPLTVPD